MPARPIVVVGSINMDLVARVERLPRPGETVPAADLLTLHGGKGANQAVAIARMGVEAILVGRVGDDAFGGRLVDSLDSQGVVVEHIRVMPNCPSGVALISLSAAGENSIVVAAGANARLAAADVAAVEDVIAGAGAVVVQLEVPQETVAAAAAIARRHGVRVIVDPAPAPREALPQELWEVDIFTPNQTEAEQLTGMTITDVASAAAAAQRLLARGPKCVVLKLGALGAFVADRGGQTAHVPACSVAVVDTTAAGDAFTGALAVALVEGRAWPQGAVAFACAAGTLATTRVGAQASMPTREEVEGFLAARQE
ncbi:MAG: ribokinase [Planctomycetia bacterium]|nr:ribokinase [Planctomycetia bacterium]